MKERRLLKALGVFVAAASLLSLPAISAQAYAPEGGVMYQVPADQPCLKGRGNCAIYVKSAQLPSGRLVATFEKSTVVTASQGATGQTLPVYKSDDQGTSWQPLSEVKAPAYLSSDPQFAKYTSNWASPYLYTLPQDVGNLKAGTLLLASTVTGEDAYYKEHKAADPNWVPTNDGDRKDMALALYSSTDGGVTWKVLNVIATAGWQGGSAGATGINIAAENTARQVDPIWEPFLMVHAGKLVAYYSDENDYLGVDPVTGVPTLDPNNATAPDSEGQILVHKTWDGASPSWSSPVVDVSGSTQNMGNGKTEIGGGRPGMTTIAQTTDGKWLLTYEYWGGGTNVKFKIADDPLQFRSASDFDGEEITGLPLDAGSHSLAQGGSPVLITLPDGRIVYNAAGSGNVWINESGRSDGAWTEYQTPVGAGYTRNLQYVNGTGRVVILQASWGGPGSQAAIRYGEVDLGKSDGTYYKLVNRKTGQVMGTGSNTNDANIGNADVPDVALESAGAAQNPDTQYWHVVTKADGNKTLLNKSGGREASIWTGNATVGQRIGQWVDNKASGSWNLIDNGNGYYRFQAAKNTNVYLTGSAAGTPLTLQNTVADGSQDWQLIAEQQPQARTVLGAQSGKCLDLKSFAPEDGAIVDIYTCDAGANQKWTLDASGQLVNASSGKCLDVTGHSVTDGAVVQQWSCTGGTNQKWTYNPLSRQLIGQQSGKCLDVKEGSITNGSRVVIWSCNNQTNQKWTIR